MRRVVLVLAAMALALLLASGVAWAVTKIGTNGPDTLIGTNGNDNLLGRGGNDVLFSLNGRDNLLGGAGRDALLGENERFKTSRGDKNLEGGRGNDIGVGGKGSDNVLGEEGNDFLVDGEFRNAVKDTLSGGDGNDVIDVINKPGVKDIVACGSGFDRVLADRKDLVAPDCERVFIGLASGEEFFESIPPSFFEGLNLTFLE
jgi:Ca2+-binding RTX toxin-like protein